MKLDEALDILNEASIPGIARTMNGLITRINQAKSPEEMEDPIKQLARIAPNPNAPLEIKKKYGSGEVSVLNEPYNKANTFLSQNAEKLKNIKMMDVVGASNAYDALKNTLTSIHNIIKSGKESYVGKDQQITDKPLSGTARTQKPAIARTPIR